MGFELDIPSLNECSICMTDSFCSVSDISGLSRSNRVIIMEMLTVLVNLFDMPDMDKNLSTSICFSNALHLTAFVTQRVSMISLS